MTALLPRPGRLLRLATRRAAGTRAGQAALRRMAPDLVAIFTWHSVGSTAAPFFDPAGDAAGTSSHCSLAAFASHIAWIRDRFHVITLDEATETLRARRKGFGWTAALTFDDGFRNAAEEAVPWLDAEGLPCTFFVNAALAAGAWVKDIDVEMLRDRDPALLARCGGSRAAIAEATEAYASWDLLRRMPSRVAVGNHGERHVRLSAVSAPEAIREIDAGLAALQTELGVRKVPYAFAFGQPSDITPAARAHASATHTAVLSAYGGFSWPGSGLADIPRVPVFSDPGPALLAEYTFPPRFLVRRASSALRGA
jgi:peptidoglycan/xylan/chitin deacetylase (PgdA/CDA1 family)